MKITPFIRDYFFSGLIGILGFGAFTSSAYPFSISVPPISENAPRMPRKIGSRPRVATGKILVELKRGIDPQEFLAETGLIRLSRIPQIRVEVLKTPEGQEKSIARQLSLREDVEFAEPDGLAYASAVPNDPFYSTHQWYLPQMNLPATWDQNIGSPNVIIAVLDTGVDARHPDLKDKIVAGWDSVNNDSNPSDDDGHGSHVSGLAAASSNNKIGIAGVSWGARIMPIKVLDRFGQGDYDAIANGMVWAVDHGAKILNLSLGGTISSSTLTNAVRYAKNHNALVLAAAGNEYSDGNPINYPAATPGVMAVGASNDRDNRATYSEVGNYLSVIAPGGDPTSESDGNNRHWIIGTWRIGSGSEGNGYESLAGTSQSTPLVSGLAALLWSAKPTATADEIRGAIEQTAQDSGKPGWDPETGNGRINAQAAIAKLSATTNDTTSPALSITFPANGDYVSGTVKVKGSVQDAGLETFKVEYGVSGTPAAWFRIGGAQTQPVAPGGDLATWSVDALTDGVYTLRLSASDRSGNSSATNPVVVNVDNTPPVLTVSQPAEGATVGNVTLLQGSATDVALNHSTVDVGAGNDPDQWTNFILQGAPSTPETLGTLNMTGMSPGPYTLRITAVDKAGQSKGVILHVTYRPTLPGDVTGDGAINISDATAIMRISVGLGSTTDLQAADVAPFPGTEGRAYGDGKVTVADAIRLLQKLLGLETGSWPQ